MSMAGGRETARPSGRSSAVRLWQNVLHVDLGEENSTDAVRISPHPAARSNVRPPYAMLTIGSTDAFERDYMQRFRMFAGQFGEFVSYERDRAARDIGLHLTHKLASGRERLSTALCWFQMKGIMASTLPRKTFENASVVKLSLDVVHLRYWFLQPVPTHLVVYVQSAETFLVMNIQELVEKRWGKSILGLQQKTATVEVPTSSLLDEQAFRIILARSDIDEWAKALNTDKESLRLCRRDYNLIWHFGTAKQRNVLHRVVFWDWQTKSRSQFYIQERVKSQASMWEDLREHMQYMMAVEDIEGAYPYLEFFDIRVAEEEIEKDGPLGQEDDEDEGPEAPEVVLANGDRVSGVNCAFEYFLYTFGARLNKLGQALYQSVIALEKARLIEITHGKSECISIAPWHGRAV
jgi:hypothetical protein